MLKNDETQWNTSRLRLEEVSMEIGPPMRIRFSKKNNSIISTNWFQNIRSKRSWAISLLD
jgi:hypothetical protein